MSELKDNKDKKEQVRELNPFVKLQLRFEEARKLTKNQG